MPRLLRSSVLAATALVAGLSSNGLQADEIIRRADERFAQADTNEVPSLQRHVLPLMGRLGCNGRACHGSFQGQGGFRLSLFGYDFKTDRTALAEGDSPRVDLKNPRNSLILTKTTSSDPDEHGGGKRMDVDSWQYRVIEKWIAAGASAVDEEKDPHFVKLVVTPMEVVWQKPGESQQLNVLAYWSDGSIEDVTPLCRFQSSDEAVAKVDLAGKMTCVGKGDTHVVAFYDNGVVPVAVMLPVSDRVGPNFPDVAAKTKVDELVLTKLQKLGVVPADVCSDADFLRRASLDVTGQLATAEEVKAFLADTSADKRAKKIDELLERPAFSAWWATKLCDILGNSENQLRNNPPPLASEHWYRWINQRLLENTHYDDIVERIVLAKGRSSDGQTFEEYCSEITSYVRKDNPADFTERETMPYYWMRQNMRTSNEKALSFSYAFLGVRLQCAECHKHPFDQWSQSDFQHFTAFFNRIISGQADRDEANAMLAKLDLDEYKKLGGNKLRQQLEKLARDGTVVPFNEIWVKKTTGEGGGKKKDKQKLATGGRVLTPKVLGGEEVVDQTYDDPREPLMDWLRQKDNPYFARSFANRVWAHYFNVGIVEPADDMNLANAPSNKELLDYLAESFIEHDYDIRALMREILNSETYQRAWQTNATNEFDLRNFSHAVPRRLPAEVVYDAVIDATAGNNESEQRRTEPVERCAIGLGRGYTQRNNANGYVLSVFGKPKRETPCDCERSNEPSLLQTVYLRNDQEVFSTITRKNGWFYQSMNARDDGKSSNVEFAKNTTDPAVIKSQIKYLEKMIDERQAELNEGRKKGKKTDNDFVKRSEKAIAAWEQRIRELKADLKRKPKAEPVQVAKAEPLTDAEMVSEAYLRTLGRYPTEKEQAGGEEYLKTSTDVGSGMRDLLWALLNTKEFVVNH
jgi:hypothetical protein